MNHISFQQEALIKPSVPEIRNNEAKYPCCGGDDSMEGCQLAAAHVFDTLRESELLKFQETPRPNGPEDPRSRKIYALDCEMVYTVWGPALARVTVVDLSENVSFLKNFI